MPGLLHHMLLSLRLNFRSTQAVVYGYLFPVIFLFAFWGVYSKENPPLGNELGQLITVIILSGACFGMPTAMVGERERGVWRRYRLLPTGTGGIVLSAMVVRIVIVAIAVVMQLVLARYVCKSPWPAHPWRLVGMYPFVCFAFLGLGLVIAMLADNVPAVQALGQVVFLPMLMIGGVGIHLSVLPNWARHVAAFLPGLYAVDAIDSAVRPTPLAGALPLGYCLFALVVIGAAGCLAGRMMFRWDAGQRVAPQARGWVALAVAAWLGVGALAEQGGYVKFKPGTSPAIASTAPSPATGPATLPTTVASATAAATTRSLMAKIAPWTAITEADVQKITYDDLPPDQGTVLPVAASLDNLDDEGKKRMDEFTSKLEDWPPGKTANLEQRVRNLLAVAAITDVLQDQHEAEIAYIVFDHVRFDVPEDKLRQILTYVSLHPEEGKVPEQVPELGFEGKVFEEGVRERVEGYARKLLARVIGRVQG
jgi:hypothetical protein